MGSTTTTSTPITKSRAVLRDIEPGSTVECARCDERIKFRAKLRLKQVICNVYEHGVWSRVEHFHDGCYEEAGEPHGPVDTTPVVKARRAAQQRAAEAQRTA